MPNNQQILTKQEIQFLESLGLDQNSENLSQKIQQLLEKGEIQKHQDFDTGGISKAVNWQGGGSFVYFELKKLQETFMELIQEARTTEELEKIWEQMKEKSFLDWMIDLRGEVGAMKDWKDLTLEKQKQALCLCLDKNQMYVNYSEIDDTQFECTEEEKRVSGEFYGE
jgi:adenine-specific DNA-methyltransferase